MIKHIGLCDRDLFTIFFPGDAGPEAVNYETTTSGIMGFKLTDRSFGTQEHR